MNLTHSKNSNLLVALYSFVAFLGHLNLYCKFLVSLIHGPYISIHIFFFMYLLRVVIVKSYHFLYGSVGVNVTPTFSSSRTSIASTLTSTHASTVLFEDVLKHAFVFHLDFGDHITRHITRAFTTFAPIKTIGVFVSNNLKYA